MLRVIMFVSLLLILVAIVAVGYDGGLVAELKTFSLRDVFSELSQDMVLHKIIYSPHFKKLIVFYYDYSSRRECWALLEPGSGEIIHRGVFPYLRFKEGVMIDAEHLLTLSWKPSVSLYLTDITTGETTMIYHRDKGTRVYNFTLMSPLIAVGRGVAVSYVDLVDEEGFTEKLMFIAVRRTSAGVALEPWIAHESISPKRAPLRTISFYYPVGIAFVMTDGIYVYDGKLRMVEELRGEKGRVLDYKRGKLAVLKWQGRGLSKTLALYQVSPQLKLIKSFGTSELGGVPLGAQFSGDGRLFIEIYDNRNIWFAYYDDNSLIKVRARGKIRGVSFSVSVDGSQIVVLGNREYQVLEMSSREE